MVELRGLEPLTSSMPWWLRRSKRRAASVDVCQGVQAVPRQFSPGAPQFGPHAPNRLPFANLAPQGRAI